MKDIVVNTIGRNETTSVCNAFIDEYMASANGSFVKVYLYLLRCESDASKRFSISSCADFLNETEKDVIRALRYWDNCGILSLFTEGEEIVGITVKHCLDDNKSADFMPIKSASAVISIEKAVEQEAKPAVRERKLPSYTAEDIEAAMVNPDIAWLSSLLPCYFDRLSTNDDVMLLVFLYNELHFSKELIIHLYETCISRGKKNNSYIQTVAISWADEGVTTVEEAEEISMRFDSLTNVVNKAWGLNRTLGEKERKYIKSWGKMGMSAELVKEACDKAILSAGKPSFAFADKVLKDWNEKGIKTLAEAQKESAANAETRKKTSVRNTQNKSVATYNNYSQRNYSENDFLEMERRLLNKNN